MSHFALLLFWFCSCDGVVLTVCSAQIKKWQFLCRTVYTSALVAH